MEEQICQSCAMPLIEEGDFGTNADTSKNEEYCQYCYADGKFTMDVPLDEFIEKQVEIGQKVLGLSEDDARETAESVIPTLNRWKDN